MKSGIGTLFKNLFSFESCEIMAQNTIYRFEDVVLNTDMGKFKAGTKFPMADFYTRFLSITLYESTDPYAPETKVHRFSMMLVERKE